MLSSEDNINNVKWHKIKCCYLLTKTWQALRFYLFCYLLKTVYYLILCYLQNIVQENLLLCLLCMAIFYLKLLSTEDMVSACNRLLSHTKCCNIFLYSNILLQSHKQFHHSNLFPNNFNIYYRNLVKNNNRINLLTFKKKWLDQFYWGNAQMKHIVKQQ